MATASRFILHIGNAPSAPPAGQMTIFASGSNLYSMTSTGTTLIVSGADIGALSDLTDVTLGTLTSGHILSYNGTVWVNAVDPANSHELLGAVHSDTTGTAASGHALLFDGTDWRPASITPSGNYATVGQGHELWAASGNLAPSGDYATVSQGNLLWKSVSDFFQPSGYIVPSGDYATVTQGHQLFAPSGQNFEAHGDYARVSELASGHLISYNGTQWVNATAATGGGSSTLAALTDTSVGAVASGHHLGYDGSNWIPTAAGSTGGNDTLTINTSGQVETRKTLFTTVLTANATEFNIEDVPIGYDYITINGQIRSNNGGNNEIVEINFNGDATTSNYRSVLLQYGTVALAKYNTSDCWFARGSADGGDATDFAHIQSTIVGYDEQDKQTYWHSTSLNNPQTANYNAEYFDGTWRSAVVVSGFRLVPQAGTNWVSGSWIEVVGVKKMWCVTDGTLGDASIVNGMIVP